MIGRPPKLCTIAITRAVHYVAPRFAGKQSARGYSLGRRAETDPRSRRRSLACYLCWPSASPQLGSCCFGDFLAVNSTGTKRPPAGALLVFLFHRRFLRWRSSVPKLKPRLRQNSLRRIPLLANSDTNCGTPLASSAFVPLPPVLCSCLHFRTGLRLSNRCVARTLPSSLRN